MIGPLVLVVAGGIAGWFSGEWAGLVAGVVAGALVSFGVMAAAAWWAGEVGRGLDRAGAWAAAPRPPGFRPWCDAIYRRVLGERPEEADGEEP